MAMRTSTPWWLSAIFAVGLFLLFLGERAFGHLDSLRYALTGVGVLLIVATTALRAVAMFSATGLRRRVERNLLLCHLGVALGLLGYLATTHFGMGLLGLDDLQPKSKDRFVAAANVLWTILVLVSLVPMMMAEISLGLSQRNRLELGDGDGAEAASVDSFRVSAMISSGLTVALAAAFLMVTCNVADQRNIRRDVSYFKTSSPGTATVAMVKSISEPVRVLLFFPEVNQVKDEVRGYFESLADSTGNIEIEEHDKVISSKLAEEYKVQQDGTIVLVRGDKNEKVMVSDDIKRARRNELRTLDSKVQEAMMRVIRAKRTAYFTVGHGEVNDQASVGPLANKDPNVGTQLIKKILGVLNYQVKDLGRSELLADVPEDATILLVMAPRTPFMDDELASIDRYLAHGGSALFVLDPMREFTLGSLEGRLGVHFDPTRLADDKRPRRSRGGRADNILLQVTDFSSHASVTSMSRYGTRDGLPMVMAGSLVDAPFTDYPDSSPADGKDKRKGPNQPKRTYVMLSSKTTFGDKNQNFVYDQGEKRGQYNLAAAIEDPHAQPDQQPADQADRKDTGMRAMVFTDAELFLDLIQGRVPLAQFMFADAVKWLGGEEQYAGTTVSEKDVRIEHTRTQDKVWFYGTIVGAPLLVLVFGLGGIGLRRRRQRRRA